MSDSKKRRIAIIGAGPIGIEAAVYALELGHDVLLFDRDEIAAHVRRWGFVELFSPWSLNVSPLGLERLKRQGGPVPPQDAYPTGEEFFEHYLRLLVGSLGERWQQHCEVTSVSRHGLTKLDAIGTPERASRRFRLALRTRGGMEHEEIADVVIDASGVYSNHGWLGDGGVPAKSETRDTIRDLVTYHLPDVLGGDRELYAGKTTLVAGSGYSAITTLRSLDSLAREVPGTEIVWLRRDDRENPIDVFEDDPLPQRATLAEFANQLAAAPPAHVRVLRAKRVRSLSESDGRVDLQIHDRFSDEMARSDDEESVRCDRVVALVGYRPDTSLHPELHVHLCYATEGPMRGFGVRG